MIRTIIPARGRKLRDARLVQFRREIRTIIPARGRKRAHNPKVVGSSPADKNHNPRKGTETVFNPRYLPFFNCQIRTIIPARGRKQDNPEIPWYYAGQIRTIIPARGRKPDCSTIRNLSPSIDKNHNPRKGTETKQTLLSLLSTQMIDKNHNPRKGTETFLPYTCYQRSVKHDKNHNPRKGTETLLSLS